MTKMNKLAIANVIALVATVGIATALLSAPRAAGQSSPSTRAGDSANPTAGTDEHPSGSGSRRSFADGSEMPRPSPAEQKAELDVDEAQVRLQSKEVEYSRKRELAKSAAISTPEVEEAELDVKLAQIQLRRAELAYDEVAFEYTKLEFIVSGHGGKTWSTYHRLPSHFAEDQQSLRNLLRSLGIDDATPWRITLLSKTNGTELEGTSAQEILHTSERQGQKKNQFIRRGDVVRFSVNRDDGHAFVFAVRGVQGQPPLIDQPLRGEQMTVQQLIDKAFEQMKKEGLASAPGDINYRMVRLGGANVSPDPEVLGEQVLQPGDQLLVQSSYRPTRAPLRRPASGS